MSCFSRALRGAAIATIVVGCGTNRVASSPDASMAVLDAGADGADGAAGDDAGACDPSCPGTACTTPADRPVVLADVDANVVALAADDTDVYFSTTKGEVLRCAKTGCACAPTQLAAGQGSVLALALDTARVYWADESYGPPIYACPKTGCDGTPTILGSPRRFVSGIVVDGETLYMAVIPQLGLYTCPISGCPNGVAAIVQHPVEALAADRGELFWTTGEAIERCSAADCGVPVVLAPNQTSSFHIAVDAERVYWTSAPGQYVLRACARTDCAGTLHDLAANAIDALAVDGTSVYFADIDGALVRCPNSGCDSERKVLAPNEHPHNVVVDDTHVFWTSYGSRQLRSMPK